MMKPTSEADLPPSCCLLWSSPGDDTPKHHWCETPRPSHLKIWLSHVFNIINQTPKRMRSEKLNPRPDAPFFGFPNIPKTHQMRLFLEHRRCFFFAPSGCRSAKPKAPRTHGKLSCIHYILYININLMFMYIFMYLYIYVNIPRAVNMLRMLRTESSRQEFM